MRQGVREGERKGDIGREGKEGQGEREVKREKEREEGN